jgi:hypothetical protein
MNLFRSKEHVRGWPVFNPESESAIKPVRDWVRLIFGKLHRYTERLAPDYLARAAEHSAGLPAALAELGQGSDFWKPA